MNLEAHPGIAIFGVDVDGPHISVDLYGGEEMLIGNVTYDISDRDCRDEALKILQAWRSSSRPLAYLCSQDGTGRLVDMDTYTQMSDTE